MTVTIKDPTTHTPFRADKQKEMIVKNHNKLVVKKYSIKIIKPIVLIIVLGFLETGCVHIAEHARQDVLPIIDSHMHLNRNIPAERLVALMDQAGVKSMVLMARNYGGLNGGEGSNEQALKYAEKYPGRFIPFIAGQLYQLGRNHIEEWTDPGNADEWAEDYFKYNAATGKFYGLGEFIIYHHTYIVFKSEIGSDVDIPVESPLMFPLIFPVPCEPTIHVLQIQSQTLSSNLLLLSSHLYLIYFQI